MIDFTVENMGANQCFIDDEGILNVTIAGPRDDANNAIIFEQILKAIGNLRSAGRKVLVNIDISKMEVNSKMRIQMARSSRLKLREVYSILRENKPDKITYVGAKGWSKSVLGLLMSIEKTFKLFDDKESAYKWLLS